MIPDTLNEFFDYPEIDSSLETIRVNFNDHKYMNSTGIASWVKWIDEVEVEKIVLVNLSVNFMSQSAMVSSIFNEKCLIESFKVPLYSNSILKDRELLVSIDDVSIDSSGNLNIDLDFESDENATDWELDLLSSSYFEIVLTQLKS